MPAGRIAVGILLLAALGVLIKFFLMLAGLYVPSASITGQKPPVEQTPAPTPSPPPEPPAAPKPEAEPAETPAPSPELQPQPDAGQRPEAGEGGGAPQDGSLGEPDKDAGQEMGQDTGQDADRGTGNGEAVADQGATPGRPGRYVVRPGDTLWGIARRFCGVGARYQVLYRHNRGQIRNPDRIWPGQAVELTDTCR